MGNKIGPVTITVRQASIRGERQWCVDARLPTGRKRQFLSSQREAERVAAELRKEHSGGAAWATLTEQERVELAGLHQAATSAGTTMATVWSEWQAGVRAASNVPSIALGEAVKRCVADKQASGRRGPYIASLRGYLARFAVGREAMPLRSITQADIRAWLDRSGGNLNTRATELNRISTLFAWAVRREFLTVNPCDAIERVTIESTPPKILRVEECDKVLRIASAQCHRALPWFALCLLAGVRPQEADRLTWADVDLERGIVTVNAAASKVRARRIVHLLPCAIAWLREAKRINGEMPLPHSTRRKAVRKVRKAIGWSAWPADILRHTAASYWLAHRQDAGAVAHELGNSAGILLRVYRELVSREDAERWVGLRP